MRETKKIEILNKKPPSNIANKRKENNIIPVIKRLRIFIKLRIYGVFVDSFLKFESILHF